MTLIEQARIIAADMWSLDGPNRKAVLNGEWDDIRQVRCALLALETQAAEIARLRGLLGEAEAGLEPFAEACTINNKDDDEDIDDSLAATKITFGQLRLARTTLAKLRAETGGGEDERP